MPYCPKCGNQYYAGSQSCSTCGQPLAEQAEYTENRRIEPETVRHQERDKPCPYCHGTGKVDGPIGGEIMVTCPVCKGRRYNLIPEDWLKCSECGATGEFTYGAGMAYTRKPCHECKGTGWTA
jgi:DnaJ-class molecular chaperone